jgi:hypothetical protein
MTEQSGPTPLSTKVEQMLTEARVIIPGCQALLGFQLVAMLTHAFDELPQDAKIMHAAGLCCVTIATILLMTPAALHRQVVRRQRFRRFLRLGSAFVIAGPLPLALGIAADVYVVFLKITHSTAFHRRGKPGVLLLAMLGLWYFYPIWLRASGAKR